ncbi:MAG: nucleoside triphosphate pyrophosphohydrolase [Cytophagales bacterium]|nr:MAG: nucleoside triphosphate pyrophosphohydrolase [Cytophagales bacterium]TAF61518.1 MAG: nucleoside triphosphate pyrophosphohydrolase [Cytophagales bacterium]
MVEPNDPRYAAAFIKLLQIMNDLREKCPWDKKQTFDTLRYLTVEETYELLDALQEYDFENIKKELGDVLLHLVFYAKIADEHQKFDMADVIESLCEKLIRRHPHIYGDVHAENADAVIKNWEAIKLQEQGEKKSASVLDGVPKTMPALVKAIRLQEKARGVGFDWKDKRQVWLKVEEEMAEFEEKYNVDMNQEEPSDEAEAEFGDLLFSLINYARFININPENALERTNKKFIKRFQYLEQASKQDGKALQDMTLEEMESYWQAAKYI